MIPLRARLVEIDRQLLRHAVVLPPTLQNRLNALRRNAEPAGESARDVLHAEEAASELEKRLDEDIGLAADLQRTVDPVLPPLATVLRWAAMSMLASALLVMGVVQLGFGDFMLQAFGVKILRATATMPCERFAFEAEKAARGGRAPEHAEWVDPRPGSRSP